MTSVACPPPSHIQFVDGPNKRRWEYLERYERQLTATAAAPTGPARKKPRSLLQRYLETAPAHCVRVVFQSDSEDSDGDGDGDDDAESISIGCPAQSDRREEVSHREDDDNVVSNDDPAEQKIVARISREATETIIPQHPKPTQATAAVQRVGTEDDPIVLSDNSDDEEEDEEDVVVDVVDRSADEALLPEAVGSGIPIARRPVTLLVPKNTTVTTTVAASPASVTSPAKGRTISSESSDESSAMSSTMIIPKTRSPNRGRCRNKHVKSAASRRLDDAYEDDSEDDDDDDDEYDDSSDEESVDSEQEARDFFYSPSPHDPKSLFTIDEFKHLWRLCEKNLGEKTEDIENGRLIRQANTRMAAGDSKAQCKAQYGRILPNATHKLLQEILQVDRDDVFVDVGHGIGNAVLQAAYTVGCESRGIEVVGDRNFIALRFKTELDELRRIRYELMDDRRGDNVGVVELKHGRLELPEYEDFIICRGRRTKAFVNNFDGVFAERSAKPGQKYHLDHFIAGLFAKMSPGSIMVTLHPLTLGHSLESANDLRSRHGLEENTLSSFFHSRTLTLGEAKDVVSWSAGGSNRKPIQVWVYTRLEQPGTEGNAVFLCNNPKCEKAINNEPQSAVGTVDADGEERCVIAECNCGNSARPLRSRRRVDYNSTIDYVQWSF